MTRHDVAGARALADQDRYQFQYCYLAEKKCPLLEAGTRHLNAYQGGRVPTAESTEVSCTVLDGAKRTTVQKAIVHGQE